MTKLLKKINEAKSFSEKLFLARDLLPGKQLDLQIVIVCQWYPSVKKYRADLEKYLKAERKDELEKPIPDPLAEDQLARISASLIEAIATGNSALFRQWAKTIEAHKKHHASPNELYAAIIAFCDPRNTTDPEKRIFTKEQIFDELKRQKLITKATHLASLEKRVRRFCSRLGIAIKATPDRRKNPGQKRL